MSWSTSNLTADSYVCALSGLNAACSQTGVIDINYSTDAGQTWTPSTTPGNMPYNQIALDGLNGVAGNIGRPHFTTDGGATFAECTTAFSNFPNVHSLGIKGTQCIMGFGAAGLYYSSDGGNNWTQSNRTTSFIHLVSMANSSNAIAASKSSSVGIFYTTDGGVTWTQSNITSGTFDGIVINGTHALAGMTDGGIYYSSDSGATWTVSTES